MPDAPKEILLPPVETLLEYAAYGWSAHKGKVTATGLPRLPEPATWWSEFGALLAATDGLARLQRLALIGMQAWGVDPSISDVLPAAFASPDILDRLAALYPGPNPVMPEGLMAAPGPAAHTAAPVSVPVPVPAPALKALPAPAAAHNPAHAASNPPRRVPRLRRPQPV